MVLTVNQGYKKTGFIKFDEAMTSVQSGKEMAKTGKGDDE